MHALGERNSNQIIVPSTVWEVAHAVPEVHAPDVHTRRRGVGARRTVPSAVRVPGVVEGTRTVAGGAELGRAC